MDSQSRYSRRVSLALLGVPVVSWLAGCGGGSGDSGSGSGTSTTPPAPTA